MNGTHRMHKLLIPIVVLVLASCTNIIRTDENTDTVRLYFISDSASAPQIKSVESSCRFIGEVIGSEGHWYSYWFFSNALMVQGAINEVKNEAYRKGGNVALVYHNIDFVTSVTLLGQVYSCGQPETRDSARF